MKCLGITVKVSKAFATNKYDCRSWNTKGIIGVKELLWPTNVKYLRLPTHHGHYTYVCTVSQINGMNTENNICLPNKEYISGH